MGEMDSPAYDQVMRIGWKITLPIAIANLVFYMCLSSI